MPVATVEKIRDREASIKKKIAGLGETPDRDQSRKLGKKLRRAQRLRRKMIVEEARRAVKSKSAAAEKPAEAPAETPAEGEATETQEATDA